jgi:hypothetical protein
MKRNLHGIYVKNINFQGDSISFRQSRSQSLLIVVYVHRVIKSVNVIDEFTFLKLS